MTASQVERKVRLRFLPHVAFGEENVTCRAVARGAEPAFAKWLRRGILGSLRERRMVGATGIEPVTPSMSTRCSPAELRALDRDDLVILL